MAITYQGAGTTAANTVAATTLAVPYPASIQAGDVLVLVVGVSGVAPTNPAGFTSAITTNSGGSTPAYRVSYKVATGSESGSLNVTTPSQTSQGRMFLFRGVDQTTPIDVAGTIFGSSTAVSAYNIPTLTTTTTGVTLVSVGIANAASGTFTPPTVPAAFTEVWDAIATTPGITTDYLIWSGSGATGTINLVHSSAVRGAAGVIALRPASTAPGQGSGTGTWTFTGAGAGSRAPVGSGAGSWTFTGTGAGSRPTKGTGAGNWSFTGTGAGSRPAKGAGTGAWSFTGAAAGKRTTAASGAGVWQFLGAAQGVAIEPGRGTGTGTWTFTGTATGSQPRRGTGAGTWAFVGTGTAATQHTGVGVEGQWFFVGVGMGDAPPDPIPLSFRMVSRLRAPTLAGELRIDYATSHLSIPTVEGVTE